MQLISFLCSLGILTADSHPIIAIFFFTPALIAYLFFKPKLALCVTIASYVLLNTIYFCHFYSLLHPNALHITAAILFAGIAMLIGLHLIVISRESIEQKLMQMAHSDALTGLLIPISLSL